MSGGCTITLKAKIKLHLYSISQHCPKLHFRPAFGNKLCRYHDPCLAIMPTFVKKGLLFFASFLHFASFSSVFYDLFLIFFTFLIFCKLMCHKLSTALAGLHQIALSCISSRQLKLAHVGLCQLTSACLKNQIGSLLTLVLPFLTILFHKVFRCRPSVQIYSDFFSEFRVLWVGQRQKRRKR